MITTTITLPIAAITLMLWILWSDSVRPHRPTPFVYGYRIVLYVAAVGVLLYNLFAYSSQYTGLARGLVVIAVLIGIGGATYFFLKLTGRIR